MKPPGFYFTVLLFVAALFIVASAAPLEARTERPKKKASVSETTPGEGAVDPIAAFQNSKAWNKLDERTQQEWLDAMKSGDTKRRMDCFVRVDAPGDRGDESFLISHGYDVRIFSGPIATGHVNAEDLPSVAGLPFVRSVRLSK